MAKKKVGGVNKGVQFSRDELNILLPQYYMIRDVLEGEPAIKGIIPGCYGGVPGVAGFGSDLLIGRAKRYLPMPNAADQSQENVERYRAYVQRAVFYGVTARTAQGMIGQIFLRPPAITTPPQLDPMMNDIDGCGLTQLQTAKRLTKDVMSYGRCGLLADFPRTSGAVSRADLNSGKIKPTITVYYPWDIINWRTETVGGKKYLTLVVLRENVSLEGDDGFSIIPEERYKVLRFDPVAQKHTVEIWRQASTSSAFAQIDTFQPLGGNGRPLTEIPFRFLGSESNDEIPDKPPLYDLASLNLAHYRNSADYEDSVYLVGQPTLVLSGLTKNWVDVVMKGSIVLGSRKPITLPANADAKLIEAKENTLAGAAMIIKEQQMVSIGAKLVEKMGVTKTATETIVESTSETSVLLNVAMNVSSGLTWAFGVCADYVNADKSKIKYALNTDYELTKMSPQDRDSIVLAWQSHATTFGEMRTALRTGGVADSSMTDDEAMAKIIAESKKFMDAGIMPAPTKNGNDPRPNSGPGQNPKDQPLPNK